jgi:hypothetical protein
VIELLTSPGDIRAALLDEGAVNVLMAMLKSQDGDMQFWGQGALVTLAAYGNRLFF